MKTRLLAALLLLIFVPQLYAQRTASNPLGAQLSVQDAGICATTNSFAWQTLPTNAGTTTVNLAGTFSGTLTIRLSNNGGSSWTTNSTTTTAGTTSISTNGFTDVCADVTTFTSGIFQVTITTGLQQVQSVVTVQSSGGVSSPIAPAAPLGYYLSPSCKDLGITNAFCFNTPANTQQNNFCTFTNLSSTVICQTKLLHASASVASNIVTYTFPENVLSTWAPGDSITVTLFAGGDTIFNITCTLSTVATQSVTCPLTHANATSTTFGTVTDTTAGPFLAGDVGKRIFGYASCIAFSQQLSANLVMTTLALTIQTVNSSSNISMSNVANATSTANQGCVIWGNPDDTGAAALDVAVQSATQCPRVHVAAAQYMFTVPHFFLNPPSCQFLGTQFPGGLTAGNMFLAAGFELDGRGTGTTNFYLTPTFPESGPGCVNGGSGLACWVVPVEGRWSDILINGGGNFSSSNFAANHILIEEDGPANLDNFTCVNFGMSPNGTIGLGIFTWGQLNTVNMSGCGDASVATGRQTAVVTAIRLSVDNPRTYGIRVGGLTDFYPQNPFQFDKYQFICYECRVFGGGASQLGSPFTLFRNEGLNVKLYHSTISPYLSPQTGIVGYGEVGTGGLLDIEDSYLDMTENGTNAATGLIAINLGNNSTVTAKNSIIKGTSGGSASAYNDTAGSTFNDMGGNTIGPITSILGGFNADGHSLKANCTGVATASSTLALISSGTSLTGTALTTACTGATLDKGVSVNGARTLQNLTCTSSATTVSVACTVMTSHNGGAFAASAITCTMTAATRCSDGTHTLVIADGDFATIEIVTGAAETGANIKAFVEWN